MGRRGKVVVNSRYLPSTVWIQVNANTLKSSMVLGLLATHWQSGSLDTELLEASCNGACLSSFMHVPASVYSIYTFCLRISFGLLGPAAAPNAYVCKY